MKKKVLKRIGIGLLFVPLSFFLIFTFGEVFSGDLSGLSHLIQAFPVALLIFLAIKKPFIGGIILLLLGLILGIMYAVDVSFEPMTVLLVEVFLFVPPFLSGVLLIISSRGDK